MDSAFTPAHRGGSGPPLVCLHGFTDTWRTWELVLPALERHHDVLAPTLAGHAGGPPPPPGGPGAGLADARARAVGEAGLPPPPPPRPPPRRPPGPPPAGPRPPPPPGGAGGAGAAGRGRARSVVALAAAGGWAAGDETSRPVLRHFLAMNEQVKAAAPHAESLMSTAAGRRRATAFTTVRHEHLPAELLAHVLRGAAACSATTALVEAGMREGWPLDPAAVGCPLRVVWGTDDRLLAWPAAAARYRAWFPTADWVVLDGVGHCPQLDVPLEAAELILGFTADRR